MTDDLTIKEAAFRVRAQLEEGDDEVLLHAGHARALVEEIERLRAEVAGLRGAMPDQTEPMERTMSDETTGLYPRMMDASSGGCLPNLAAARSLIGEAVIALAAQQAEIDRLKAALADRQATVDAFNRELSRDQGLAIRYRTALLAISEMQTTENMRRVAEGALADAPVAPELAGYRYLGPAEFDPHTTPSPAPRPQTPSHRPSGGAMGPGRVDPTGSPPRA